MKVLMLQHAKGRLKDSYLTSTFVKGRVYQIDNELYEQFKKLNVIEDFEENEEAQYADIGRELKISNPVEKRRGRPKKYTE